MANQHTTGAVTGVRFALVLLFCFLPTSGSTRAPSTESGTSPAQTNAGVQAAGGGLNLRGGDSEDVLEGGEDNDTLDGAAGDDWLFGEAGIDFLLGGSGSDTLDGGEGDDVLAGGDDFNLLVGGEGNDVLLGGDGNDTLSGGDGEDVMEGGPGIDDLDGADGNDILSGGAGNDVLHGGDGDDTLNGGPGQDALFAREGHDLLQGGEGDDVLEGGDDNDTLDGGDDDDILDGGSDDDTLLAGDGDDAVVGGVGQDALYGGNGQDILNGGPGDDWLLGGRGADPVVGGRDNDLIVLRTGDVGGDEHESVNGETGDDTLILNGFTAAELPDLLTAPPGERVPPFALSDPLTGGTYHVVNVERIQHTHLFTQIGAGANGVGSLRLINPSTTTPSRGSVGFFGDDGTPLALSIGGAPPQPNVAFSVPPLGTADLDVTGPGGLVSAATQVLVDQPLAGLTQAVFPGSGVVAVGESRLGDRFVMPVVENEAAGVSTGVAIFNGDIDGVQLIMHGTGGADDEFAIARIDVPAGGHRVIFVQDLFPGFSTFQGAMTVEAASIERRKRANSPRSGFSAGRVPTS